MRRSGGGPAVVLLLAAALAVAISAAGCEQIVQWTGEDGGEDGGDGGGGDAGDGGGDLGDGGSGAWLVSFTPDASYLRAPADGLTPTYPEALAVTILRGGEQGVVHVEITSTDTSVAQTLSGTGVDIPPGSSQVAVPLRSQAAGTAVLTARFDGGTIPVTVTVLPTVVISEISAEALANANDEFVELYNPTSLSFSLANHVVQYRSAAGASFLEILTLDGGARIQPYGYFLIGMNSYTTGTSGPAADARASGGGVFLSNSAGSVRLGAPGIGTAPSEVLTLDLVGYGGASSAEDASVPAPGAGSWGSLERKARQSSTSGTMGIGGTDSSLGNAYDTGDNSMDFVTRGLRDPQNSSSAAEPPP
ncbi:MAG TPA: lamin tail domain-containing protein [Myxococcales bacterium]|nr:lamin tail domain-containing protein [Myxococcales bacterium]